MIFSLFFSFCSCLREGIIDAKYFYMMDLLAFVFNFEEQTKSTGILNKYLLRLLIW